MKDVPLTKFESVTVACLLFIAGMLAILAMRGADDPTAQSITDRYTKLAEIVDSAVRA